VWCWISGLEFCFYSIYTEISSFFIKAFSSTHIALQFPFTLPASNFKYRKTSFRLSNHISVTRAKLATQATYARARGTAIETGYPQTERTVGEILTKSAEEIGPSSYYGQCNAYECYDISFRSNYYNMSAFIFFIIISHLKRSTHCSFVSRTCSCHGNSVKLISLLSQFCKGYDPGSTATKHGAVYLTYHS